MSGQPPEAAMLRPPDSLEEALIWRIGLDERDNVVVVRVGLASSARLFARLDRLRNVSDADLQQAESEDRVVYEWVGPFFNEKGKKTP